MMTLPLHPYQEPAVDQFLSAGALLVAFEMGLGKTPIAIACAEELLGCRDITTALLVVPASLKYQWAQALVKFTDIPATIRKVKGSALTVPEQSSCLLLDGSGEKRRALLTDALRDPPEYIIASYENVLSDTRYIRRLHPGLVVLDEASAIKNFGSKRSLAIKRSLASEFRLALTGTPVENKPEEIFSIMEWVDPQALGPFDLFEKTFIERRPNGTVKKYKNVALLHDKLAQRMTRRSRADEDVARYLPETDHGQWYAEMDAGTRAAYDLMAADLLSVLLSVRASEGFDLGAYYAGQQYNENTGLGRVMARQQAIELLLDHPRLVELSAQSFADSRQAQEDGEHKAAWPGSRYCSEAVAAGHLATAALPKLDFLTEKLREILDFPANKILVFSRYPAMLSMIAERFADAEPVIYHGGMSATAKASALQDFTTRHECRLFLSSHAGAYGTDMHMANYLINYDLPWSGGTWDQINGRHQRVSSEFGKVYIRDIIMSGTTEVRKLAMLLHKQRVAQAVVDGILPSSGRIENDLVSLTDFLLQG